MVDIIDARYDTKTQGDWNQMEGEFHKGADSIEIRVSPDKKSVYITFYQCGQLVGTYVGPSFDFKLARDTLSILGGIFSRSWNNWSIIDGPADDSLDLVAFARAGGNSGVYLKMLTFPTIEGYLVVDPFGMDTDEIVLQDMN
jgi:hypothetical protein